MLILFEGLAKMNVILLMRAVIKPKMLIIYLQPVKRNFIDASRIQFPIELSFDQTFLINQILHLDAESIDPDSIMPVWVV